MGVVSESVVSINRTLTYTFNGGIYTIFTEGIYTLLSCCRTNEGSKG